MYGVGPAGRARSRALVPGPTWLWRASRRASGSCATPAGPSGTSSYFTAKKSPATGRACDLVRVLLGFFFGVGLGGVFGAVLRVAGLRLGGLGLGGFGLLLGLFLAVFLRFHLRFALRLSLGGLRIRAQGKGRRDECNQQLLQHVISSIF